jgi:hypothetical protein
MPAAEVSSLNSVTVVIGGLAIEISSADAGFITMLEQRYTGFVGGGAGAPIRLAVEIVPPSLDGADEDLVVQFDGRRWTMTRGDFRADWNPETRQGSVRQAAYPYAIDSVMRIIHSLVLAQEGGFLLHAASVVRGGRAFIFSGVSGAGKTTISRLAPDDATLLTDEISYLRKTERGYYAFGTPFAGDLGRSGENLSAPLGGLYLLEQGPADSIRPLAAPQAARRLLRNILFFADDRPLVQKLFDAACDFVSAVPVYELTFRPTPEVWKIVQ